MLSNSGRARDGVEMPTPEPFAYGYAACAHARMPRPHDTEVGSMVIPENEGVVRPRRVCLRVSEERIL